MSHVSLALTEAAKTAIALDGLVDAARRLGVTRDSLARAALGQPVRQGTRYLLAHRLGVQLEREPGR